MDTQAFRSYASDSIHPRTASVTIKKVTEDGWQIRAIERHSGLPDETLSIPGCWVIPLHE